MVLNKRSGPIQIRRASAADAALLARVGEDTFFDSFAADNTPEDMAAYLRTAFSPEKQAAELADPGSLFLIASVKGDMTGYAQLHAGQPADGVIGSRPIELARLYSARSWIGRGVGPALMDACLAEARQLGHDIIWLGVWERNARAIAFYRKWGFSVVGTQPFLLGADRQTDYVMAKTLSSAPLLRKAFPDDAPALGGILRETGWFATLQAEPPAGDAQITANLEPYLQDGSHSMYVAEDPAGQVVGYIAVHWLPYLFLPGPEGFISELFVSAAGRGQGTGGRLLQVVEQEARSRGCFRLSLLNGRQRESYRRRFYQKQGWEERPGMANFIFWLSER